MSNPKATIVMLPLRYPCGSEATCCGSIGQSSATIEAIKEAVEKKVGNGVPVVDIETIDTEDPIYAPVVKAFNSFGAGALPIITLDGKAVCMGTIVLEQVVSALERELKKKTPSK